MRKCGCHSHNGLVLSPEDSPLELSLEGLTGSPSSRILTGSGSVSGLELERDLYEMVTDSELDEQARRFHSGS